MLLGLILLGASMTFAQVSPEEAQRKHCSLNGRHSEENGGCVCDPGWKGATCAVLDLAPASPSAFGFYDRKVPSWGGSAVFSEVSMVKILLGSSCEHSNVAQTSDNTTEFIF